MGSENQGMIRPDASDADIRDMAREWYGYGRWDVPYWFIGPEPGMKGGKKNDSLGARCTAWIDLGRGELIDCKCHHFKFGECDWHRDVPPPRPQATWKQLIRLLLATRDGSLPDTIKDILPYQQKRCGMKSGETCVIELCSLAANKLKAKKAVSFDPDAFREERIKIIRTRVAKYKPAFVVMYGRRDWTYWEAIAGKALSPGNILRVGPTVFVFADHPVAHGLPNSYWLQLAAKLRRECQK
jgi:hypothetical protein